MKESDKEYYERQEAHNEKHLRAVSKARNRGEVFIEWNKHNKLTSKTLAAFQKAMKQADKEWESANTN